MVKSDETMDARGDLVVKVAVVVTIVVVGKVDLNLSKKNSKKYCSRSLVLLR